MCDMSNPYASPRCQNTIVERVDSSGDGLWRDGELLVMQRTARLPNICVRSGVATTLPGIARRYRWVPTWVLFTLFFGPIALVLILLLQKQGVLDVPLSLKERQQRQRRKRLGLVIFAAGVALSILLLGYFQTWGKSNFPHGSVNSAIVVTLCFATSVLVCAIGVGIRGKAEQVVAVTRVSESLIWLRGVHANLLMSLPIYEQADPV